VTKEQAITYLKKLSDTYHCMRSWDEVGRVEKIIAMLQNATIWTPCEERMPTVEDGDEYGRVNTMCIDGTVQTSRYRFVLDDPRYHYAWSRIEQIGGGNG